jgi:glycosyltransferase involved in cell wall biosynthesis
MKPSLCLFTDSLSPSGLGEHMLLLASELRYDYRLSFVCPPSAAGKRLLQRAKAMDIPSLALKVRSSQHEHALCEWIYTHQVEIFHCHAGVGWEGHHGIYAARLGMQVPVVVRTEHLPYLLTEPMQQDEYRRMADLTDCLICVSEEARATYLEAGIPEEKLRVVHNGVALAAPERTRAKMRDFLAIPQHAPVVITIGRLTEQKGHAFLLDAIPAVLEQVPDAIFLWVGEGDLEETLRGQVHASGLQGAVRFLGHRKDVPDLLAAADLFVLPSLFEGLPLSVLEAMAAGLPVIGTHCCGTSEAVQDGITGRLVAPRDAQSLGAVILELLTQPHLASRWGAAGQQRAACKFSVPRMVSATAAIYQELRASVQSHSTSFLV